MVFDLPSQCTLTAFGKYVSVQHLLSDNGPSTEYVNYANDKGDTPLQLAARNGHNAVVNLLVYIISRTECQYPGQSFTSILLAAVYGQESVDEVEWPEWNGQSTDLGHRKMVSCHPF
ncbi:hypothetical protein BDV24DRAFT_156806 [Aspergillus arachidicola]|uniref:Ankyrin repeat-containing domain protein n=1 Tax=Aspergillus arachidicola TaxID=656916 RepID=A0A5N6XMV8_9EURO|nr:hypothetical protein BDV24DRAFT_156806 [Aspergillus arachidicola]